MDEFDQIDQRPDENEAEHPTPEAPSDPESSTPEPSVPEPSAAETEVSADTACEAPGTPDTRDTPEAQDAPDASDTFETTEPSEQNETVTGPADDAGIPSGANGEQPAGRSENVERPAPEGYRWDYIGQVASARKEDKKERRRGAWIYAGIMTGLFAVSFVILIAVLLIGGKDASASYLSNKGTRVIFVRDNGEGNALTPGEIYAKTVNSVVSVKSSLTDGSSVGAGVIMSSDGYIITNYHVVKGAHSITVGLYSGKEYTATLVGAHPEDDLALLKIKAIGLQAATFADSDNLVVGEPAYAIGHPGGLEFSWTFTGGWVSAVERQVLTSAGYLVKVVQTDASVNTGNSGGALIDGEGRVIGIVSMKLADGYDGIGFALPSNHTLDVMNDIIENGSDVEEMELVNRPVIGITGVGVVEGNWYRTTDEGTVYTVTDEETALALGCYYAPHTGVWVIEVKDKGSAKGVLLPGDVITEADGVTVTTIEQMIGIFGSHKAGDLVQIKFWRNGAEQTATLTLVASVD